MRDIWDWDGSFFLGSIPEANHTYNVVGNMNEHGLVIGETTFGGTALSFVFCAVLCCVVLYCAVKPLHCGAPKPRDRIDILLTRARGQHNLNKLQNMFSANMFD